MTTQGDDSGRGMDDGSILALGVGLGIVFGTAFGSAFGDVGVGVALGIVFGAGIGVALAVARGRSDATRTLPGSHDVIG